MDDQDGFPSPMPDFCRIKPTMAAPMEAKARGSMPQAEQDAAAAPKETTREHDHQMDSPVRPALAAGNGLRDDWQRSS